MSELTEQEQIVLSAIENEATGEQGAWENAAIYCDDHTGVITVKQFRQLITTLTGLDFTQTR